MNPLPHCPPPLPIVPIWGTALEYYSPEVRHTWAVTEPTAVSSDVWCRETFWVTVYEVHTGEGRGEDIFEQNGQNFHGLHARIWNKSAGDAQKFCWCKILNSPTKQSAPTHPPSAVPGEESSLRPAAISFVAVSTFVFRKSGQQKKKPQECDFGKFDSHSALVWNAIKVRFLLIIMSLATQRWRQTRRESVWRRRCEIQTSETNCPFDRLHFFTVSPANVVIISLP